VQNSKSTGGMYRSMPRRAQHYLQGKKRAGIVNTGIEELDANETKLIAMY
jgi:hypothetical protein